MSRGVHRVGTGAVVALALLAPVVAARPAAAAASPAAAVRTAARTTIAASGFTIANQEKIRRMGQTFGYETRYVYQAPDRTAGGAIGQQYDTVLIDTTRFLPRLMSCPGGTKAVWYWVTTVPQKSGGQALGTGYLYGLLTLRNVRQRGSTFTSVTAAPATPSQRLAFGRGQVVTTVTVTVRDGYVAASTTRLASSVAVLTDGWQYSAFGTSPPVEAPPASLAFTSSSPAIPPRPPAASVCPAA